MLIIKAMCTMCSAHASGELFFFVGLYYATIPPHTMRGDITFHGEDRTTRAQDRLTLRQYGIVAILNTHSQCNAF